MRRKWFLSVICLLALTQISNSTKSRANITLTASCDCALTLIKKLQDPSDKADSLAEIAGLYVKEGDRGTASKLLFEALSYAEKIEHPLDKAGAIRRISEVGKIEHLECGLLIARTIKEKEPNHIIWAYRELAENFIRLGKNDRAIAVLDEATKLVGKGNKDDREEKELDFSYLGELYAKAGAWEKALQSCKGFENPARNGEVLSESAIAMARVEKYERALGIAEKVQYERRQIHTFIEIAKSALKNKNQNVTLKALSRAHHYALKVKYADPQWGGRASVLVSVLLVYNQLGKVEKAKEILAEAFFAVDIDIKHKDSELVTVSDAFAQLRLFDAARNAAEQIQHKETQSHAFVNLARRMVEAGRKKDAFEILSDVEKITINKDCSYDKPLEYPDPKDPSRNIVIAKFSNCLADKVIVLMDMAELYSLGSDKNKAVHLLDIAKKDMLTNEQAGISEVISHYIKLREYETVFDLILKSKYLAVQAKALAQTEIKMGKLDFCSNAKVKETFDRLDCNVEK